MKTSTKFYLIFGFIALILICFFLHNYFTCNCVLLKGHEIMNYNTFVANFGIMCFTALNVWVVFMLQKTIQDREQKESNIKAKNSVFNNFSRMLHKVFDPDHEMYSSEYDRRILIRSLEYFKNLSMFAKIMHVINSDKYKAFIENYNEFIKISFRDQPEEIQNTPLNQRAYSIYQDGLQIQREMSKEIEKYINENF